MPLSHVKLCADPSRTFCQALHHPDMGLESTAGFRAPTLRDSSKLTSAGHRCFRLWSFLPDSMGPTCGPSRLPPAVQRKALVSPLGTSGGRHLPSGLFRIKQGVLVVMSPVVGPMAAPGTPRAHMPPITLLPLYSGLGDWKGGAAPVLPAWAACELQGGGWSTHLREFKALQGLREEVWSSVRAAGRASWRGCPHRNTPPGGGNLNTSPDTSRTRRASNPRL